MFKMAVGYSDDVDEGDAIAEALDEAVERLDGASPDAAILFAAVDYEHDPLLGAVMARFPSINLIGCVADAQMSSPAGFADDGVTLTLLASDVVEFTSGVGEDVSSNPEAAARDAIRQALGGTDQEPALAIALTDLLQTDLSAVVAAMSSELGEGVPIVGGASAAEDLLSTPWLSHQFFGDRVLSDSLPVLVLSGPLKTSAAVAHGWTPTGKPVTVTQSDRNRVDALEGETVIDYYRHYLGDDLGALFATPLAVFDDDDRFVLRAVTASDEETGTASFMGEVPQGSAVQISMTTTADILKAADQSVGEALANYPGSVGPQGAFVVSCAVRRMLLGSQAEQEAAGIKNEFGDAVPMAGFYAWAEIGPFSDGRTMLHNATFVTLLFGT